MSTPGGTRLRQLRKASGRPQMWVELEAEPGSGYLQRLESGRVVYCLPAGPETMQVCARWANDASGTSVG